MGGDSQVNEHELKAALIQKLKPLYAPSEGPLLYRVFNQFYEAAFGGYNVNINVDNFNAKDADQFSESKQVGRTVAALKKIKEFNHHYFSAEEARILDPLPTGIIPEAMRLCFAGWDALVLGYMWRTWSFNPKSLAYLGTCIGIQVVAMQFPNIGNEFIQYPRRRLLAKQYIDAYGYDYFHNILDPRYDLHKLHDLHNKLN